MMLSLARLTVSPRTRCAEWVTIEIESWSSGLTGLLLIDPRILLEADDRGAPGREFVGGWDSFRGDESPLESL